MAPEERYTFFVEWYDTSAALTRVFQLVFYTDQTIEMFDIKNRRTFLKRMKYPDVRLADLFVGNTIAIHSRQLKITEYGDSFTAARFEESSATSVAIIKPRALEHVPAIMKSFASAGLVIAGVRTCIPPRTCPAVTPEHDGVCVAVLLKASNAIDAVEDMAAQSGGLYTSTTTADEATEATAILFENTRIYAPKSENATLLVIRPHAFKEGLAGNVLASVLDGGFKILTMATFTVSRPNAEEFLEVYKGVVPEYRAYVEDLMSGMCLAAEVAHKDFPEESVPRLRALAGAADPEVARLLHPESIRAAFAQSKVKNVVHCTDLPEDGALEVDYFFNILAN